tara:strand:+ start:578 stop:2290 length:1713 start_codon:yes stop_codon:yes gene_type:complete
MYRGNVPLKKIEILGSEDIACVKLNHQQMIGRGSREYCLSLRENLLENRDYRVPEDWDRDWNVNLGPAWHPGEVADLKCWFQPEYFHPWADTSTTQETFQPPESVAVDRTITSSGTQSPTSATINAGRHYGTSSRGIMVWDLTDIPSTATIESATFTLKHESNNCSGSKVVNVYRLTTTGVDENVHWTTTDGSTSWSTAGGDYTTTNGLSQTIDCDSDTDFVDSSSDLVALLQDAIDNRSGLLSIIIGTQEDLEVEPSGAQRIQFHSSSASSSGDRPKIVITFKTGVATTKVYRAEDRTGSYNLEQNDEYESLPTFTSGSELLNDHKGLKFSGGLTPADYMTIPDSSVGTDFDVGVAGGVPSSNFFGAVVVNAKGTVNSGGNYSIFSKGGEHGIEFGVNDTTDYKFFLNLAGQSHVGSGIASTDGLFVVCFQRSGTNVKIWVNGVEDEDTTANASDVTNARDVYFATREVSSSDRWGNLSYAVPNAWWDGILYEFMWIKDARTDDERQQIEGYLAHKYGLTGKLAADHPYKANPKRFNLVKETSAGSSANLLNKRTDRATRTSSVGKNYT